MRLNKGELPTPHHDGAALEPGVNCASYADADDANGDGVFNVLDYACDSRVDARPTPRRVGPADMLDPQDLLIAFSDGTDDDGNGFADDIAGWDFLDNDNDPFDDVQYGHGTGEAQDSSAEANNGGDAGRVPELHGHPAARGRLVRRRREQLRAGGALRGRQRRARRSRRRSAR